VATQERNGHTQQHAAQNQPLSLTDDTHRICERDAPRAIRTPNSDVRRATENDRTPNNPIAARPSASVPNPEVRKRTSRSRARPWRTRSSIESTLSISSSGATAASVRRTVPTARSTRRGADRDSRCQRAADQARPTTAGCVRSQDQAPAVSGNSEPSGRCRQPERVRAPLEESR
jgi:hypothetical protein